MQDPYVCLTEMQTKMMSVLAESGKGFDQTGVYQDCLASLQSIYYFIMFKNVGANDTNRVFMGLCAPDICSAQDVQEDVDMLMITGNLPLRTYSVTVPSEYEYPKGGLFWFTVVWLGLLGGLVVLATLARALKKSTNKYLNCFALQENLKIFEARESSLTFFNGVRSICLFWIVLGHSVTIRVVDSENWITLQNQFSVPFAMLPLGAFFAVDIFFYLGGFLLGYVFFTQLKRNNILVYVLAMIHRLLRFYPSYLTAILIWYQIFPHLGSGPFWPLVERFVEPCQFMWRNVLFIDNMWESFSCLPWAWYLSNDIQLFLVCLIVLFLFTRVPRTTVGLVAGMVLGSLIYNFVESYKEGYITVAHISDIFFRFNPYFFKLYIKPWSRCPPYLLGLLLGIEYFKFYKYNNQLAKDPEFEGKEKVPRLLRFKNFLLRKPWFRYAMYWVGLTLVFFLIFIPRTLQLGGTWTQTQHSLYLSLSKLTFTLGVAMILLPSTVGIKDLVGTFFDTRAFSMVAKISFWTYLIHYIVIMRNSYAEKQSEYFTFFEVFQHYVTDLTISLFLGLVMTMVVEAPFVKLEKFVFKRDSPHKHHHKKEEETAKTPLVTKEEA